MKHSEQKSKRVMVETLMFRAFVKGFLCGMLTGSACAGLGIGCAVGFWMFT